MAADTTKNTPKIDGDKNIVRRKLAKNPTICITNVLEVKAKIPRMDFCVIKDMSISSIFKIKVFP